MKTAYLILTFLIFCFNAFGQKEIDTLDGVFGDAFYKSVTKVSDELELRSLLETKDSINLRIWYPHALIDITLNNKISGTLYPYVWKTNKQEEDKKVISKKIELTDSVTRTILDNFFSENINTFKDTWKMEDYPMIEDGVQYSFELATPTTYKFFTFNNPQSVSEIKEARTVEQFVNEVATSTSLSEHYKSFENELPIGTYRIGGIIMWKTKK